MSGENMEDLFFIDRSGNGDANEREHRSMTGENDEVVKSSSAVRKVSRKRGRETKPVFNTTKEQHNLTAKDDLDLERIVFGDNLSKAQKHSKDGIDTKADIGVAPSHEEQSSDDEDLDLYTLAKRKKPAWEDNDDKNLSFALQENTKLRKLRTTEDENNVTGDKFEQKLRSQFEKLVGNPKWAEQREEEIGKEIMSSTAADLRGKALHLPQAVVDIQQLRDVNIGKKYTSPVTAAEFHPNSKVVLTAGSGNTFDLYQIVKNGNQKIQTVYLEKFPIRHAHFSCLGEEIIITSNKKFFYTYDIKAGKVATIHGIRGHKEKSIDMFSVSRDGAYIAFRGSQGYVHLLSAKTKQSIHSFKMNSEVKNISFIPGKNQLMSSGGSGEVYIWDIRARRCLHKFQDDGCIKATSLAVSSNAQFYACGSNSGVVNIYDDHCLRESQPTPLKTVMSLLTPVNNLTFNPTSEILALSSEVGKDKLKLLHTSTMTVFQNWPSTRSKLGHVQSTDFSAHGGYMTAGTTKGVVKLFRLHHFPDL